MGLTYHYKFYAPAKTSAAVLETFLKTVETDAKRSGFGPTTVLNAEFDSPQRQDFARRLTTGLRLQSEKLKGVPALRTGQVWDHDPIEGECRIIPKRAAVLVITDERGCELVLGFFQYPAALKDLNGRDAVRTGVGKDWIFEDFIKTPDQRIRELVKRFADAGYVDAERDDFAPENAQR